MLVCEKKISKLQKQEESLLPELAGLQSFDLGILTAQF